jgi:hypothetical protein
MKDGPVFLDDRAWSEVVGLVEWYRLSMLSYVCYVQFSAEPLPVFRPCCTCPASHFAVKLNYDHEIPSSSD